MSTQSLAKCLQEVRNCQLCAAHLPFPPKPTLRISETARILIVGQAPSTRVHATGIPWNDPSGDRLRHWLQIERHLFYDVSQIAIMPTGLCYPGKGKSGDLPPRPECAPHWHPQILPYLSNVELTLLIGQYAQRYYLQQHVKKNLTETVRAWQDYLPNYLPLPHPSPRNLVWLKRNPWFDEEVIPFLRQRVKQLLFS